MWNELTISWNDLTIDWNDLATEQNDHRIVRENMHAALARALCNVLTEHFIRQKSCNYFRNVNISNF